MIEPALVAYPYAPGQVRGSSPHSRRTATQAQAEAMGETPNALRAAVLAYIQSAPAPVAPEDLAEDPSFAGQWQNRFRDATAFLQTIRRRMSDLKAAGLIADTDHARPAQGQLEGGREVVRCIDTARIAKFGTLQASNGGGWYEHTSEAPTRTETQKNAAFEKHANWVLGGAPVVRDSEYWRHKADTAIRALGRITAAVTLEEAKQHAHKALGAR